MEYPTAEDIINKMIELKSKGEVSDDLDEFVYDAISEWDEYFEDDEDWYHEMDEDEDDDDFDMCNDIKDQLRDRLMEFFEDENVKLEDLNQDFLTDDKVKKWVVEAKNSGEFD